MGGSRPPLTSILSLRYQQNGIYTEKMHTERETKFVIFQKETLNNERCHTRKGCMITISFQVIQNGSIDLN